ncbi:ABSCISIC ACID-INSENSITIVE 5-like protein 3 isoform X2 [Tasmannia lanceolata]|uniref:ABSCISIC ACID-INSENSITIVE 5-like protein 3 isoform X2 n=1 Tax=Tasmannia lanceolata TaxID=3420 RepID=UPI004062E39E
MMMEELGFYEDMGEGLWDEVSDSTMVERKRRPQEVGPASQQKQRRMIKNRESAARSREKQRAYTVELESEVQQLKDENAVLTRQWLMETLIPVEERSKPTCRLRRTRSI